MEARSEGWEVERIHRSVWIYTDLPMATEGEVWRKTEK